MHKIHDRVERAVSQKFNIHGAMQSVTGTDGLVNC